MARKGKAMEETTEGSRGFVLAAPGSGALRWVCDECAPSYLRAGWRHPEAAVAQEWLAAAQPVGLAPQDAVLLAPEALAP